MCLDSLNKEGLQDVHNPAPGSACPRGILDGSKDGLFIFTLRLAVCDGDDENRDVQLATRGSNLLPLACASSAKQ